ncbi:MAG: NADH-quinone oxidoreductase subunit D [Pirellulaceae bacterium]|jgi:NADH-quinone oxidoreductase subunit D|nr:NADH-quinone oxidoreductase subunit D [Thermoguttaceae bacterium]MDI9443777.1 NADH-quinone oxidoreductase subunit D [Planctomycetota bacterium]NLZ01046.1 NADH-quinone oxidoreductase subunit D [Pirellulaceae bacterium]
MPVERVDPELVEFDVRTDEMLINMGPQHPSTHGVLRLVLRTDGEVVSSAAPHIGYLHRCAEKIGENVSPRQWIPYTDRMDYLAGMNMNLGWAMTVEKLMDLEVSEKTRHLRVIVCELNRIASHLVAAGTYGLDLGSFTPFLYCFREREKILNLFEAVCGARLTYSYIAPGGLIADLPPGWLEACERCLGELQAVVPELHAMLTSNEIFIRRTAGVGVLSPEMAIDYGCSGPVLRGSGVKWDLRRDGQPPVARMYEDYRFEVIAQVDGSYPRDQEYPPVPPEAVVGDCWHRFYVRMLEVVQSIGLVRQAIEHYRRSAGPVSEPIKITQKLPRGEAYLETEAPKGQMGFLVVGDGTAIPWRVRARSSCFCNLSVLTEISRGCLLADIPAILGSLDIVLGEIDR